MPKSPLATSVVSGAVLQVVVVLLGRLIPPLGVSGNVYPVAAGILAALAGMRFSRRSPRGPIGPTLRGGGLAGAGSSLIGSIAAALAAVVTGPPVQVVGIATVTGAVAGVIGSVVGRGLPAPVPVAQTMFPPAAGDKTFRD